MKFWYSIPSKTRYSQVLLLGVVNVHADEKMEICNLISGTSKQIMISRQGNELLSAMYTRFEKAHKKQVSKPMTSSEKKLYETLKTITFRIIDEAYKEPVHSIFSINEVSSKFADTIFMDCIKGGMLDEIFY